MATPLTIRDLAALCGVAVSTASRALNGHPEVSEATRQRVLEMAKKYNFVPNSSARSLKLHTDKVIALLVQGDMSMIFLPMIDELNAAIKQRGYSLMLTFIPDDQADPSTVARIVRDRKISGVIFLGRYSEIGQGALSSYRLAELGTPTVFCTTEDFSNAPAVHSSVAADDRGDSTRVVEQLIALGHRRIACIGTGPLNDPGQAWAMRVEGYRDAMVNAGLSYAGIIKESAQPEAVYTLENGYRSASELLDAEVDFTAIFGICDSVAIGACKALTARGIRIPDDVSVAGFDDIEIARFVTPGITTVAQPLSQIVAETVRVLFETIADPGRTPEHVRIPGEPRIRESTGPVNVAVNH